MSQPAIILTVIGAYFALWLLLAYLSARRADSATYYNAGRRMPWPLVAVAMLGAPITGVTFISVPGMVAAKGFSYLQMCLGFFVGYLLIAFVLVPVFYRLRIVSVYGYLEQRFGATSSRTGAWLFVVSKIIGISIRFLAVCAMLQLLVFDPLGIPLTVSILFSFALIWLTTVKGGVKSVIFTDVLKSACLLLAICLCLWYVAADLGLTPRQLAAQVSDSPSSRIFFLDDFRDSKFFWKQFVAGIFIVVAMTGLDQDMMQRTLACRNARDSRKNLIAASLMQTGAIALLLILGVALGLFTAAHGIDTPERSDNLFATVAFHPAMPLAVGALFILGLIAATYASVGSALTAMTTTLLHDILPNRSSAPAGAPDVPARRPNTSSATADTASRSLVHTLLAAIMALLVIAFYYINRDDAISTVYTLISFTDGPILGLFAFGLLTRRPVNDRLLPAICILAPVLSWALQWAASQWLAYEIGFELLILNASLTLLLLWSLTPSRSPHPSPDYQSQN